MTENLKQWLKSSDSPFAKSLFQIAKLIRNPQMFVIPGFHACLYKLHLLVKTIFSELLRIFYFTPIFKSQIKLNYEWNIGSGNFKRTRVF